MKKWIILTVVTVVVVALSVSLIALLNTLNTPETAANANKPQPAQRFKHACDIADAKQINEVFQLTFSTGTQQAAHTGPSGAIISSCKFIESNSGSNRELLDATNVEIELHTHRTEKAAQNEISRIKETAASDTSISFIKTDVLGIGDDAFFFQSQAPASLKTEEYLYVLKGNQIIHLSAVKISGINHENAQAALTALAEKTLN